MYPPPVGEDLTPEQARELDDTFLASNPFEYFRSRIASLVSWVECAPRQADSAEPAVERQPPACPLRAEFNGYLGQSVADGPFNTLDVDAQIAADALALRHHAAEALVRLACARLAPEAAHARQGLWAAIANGPVGIGDVVARLLRSTHESDPADRFIRTVLPEDQRKHARVYPEVAESVNVFVAWLRYAAALLSPAEINLHAAHNKVKHGLAVRPRADMRVDLIMGPLPSPEGIPLSVFNSETTITIFDRPVLELLARGPKTNAQRQGLELTQLRLNSAALLADAFMIAMTHGAMFHVAAVDHFDGRDDLPDFVAPPAFPGLPVNGPRPDDIDADAPLGMRFPLTAPPGGNPVARGAGIGFRTYFQSLKVDHSGSVEGQIVEG